MRNVMWRRPEISLSLLWCSLPCLFLPAAAPLVGAEWGAEVTLGRGAWGRLAPLANGDWLAVVTRFSKSEPSRLAIEQSTNAGRAWLPLSDVREAGRKLDNGHLLTLSNGRVLLTGRSLIDGQSYRLPVYRSADRGQTWKQIGNVDTSEGAPGTKRRQGLWEPFLFRLPDGKVSVIYSSEKHAGYSQVLSQKVSPDEGATWGQEMRIVEQPNGGSLRPGMGVVARLADGRFFMAYEVVGLGRGEVHCKISADGVVWPPGLGRRIPGHEAAPFVTVLSTGRLLLTSCSNILSSSDDAGQTWRAVAESPWPAGFKYTWPALYEIRPGEVAAEMSAGTLRLRFGTLRSESRL
jgi:hypothetical protein